MVPYLKGAAYTIDSWRPHCDADGWRIPGEWGVTVEFEARMTEAPKRVKAVSPSEGAETSFGRKI
jgi:hypothetical protein